MPVNLDPRLVAYDHVLLRGALVILPNPAGSGRSGGGDATTAKIMRFQYNPETVTRTRTGEFKGRRLNTPAGGDARSQAERTARSGHGAGQMLAKAETISFKLTFDATEAILAGRSTAIQQGVLPWLAVLEKTALGKEQVDERQWQSQRATTSPVRPDELLLVLGRRQFPVVLTSLTITEQKFSPELVPIRAECDVKFRVLEPFEAAFNPRIREAFDKLLSDRAAAEGQALSSEELASGDLYEAVAGALYGGFV